MSGFHELPEQVFEFLEQGVVSEFATVSQSGVPIDTPTYYFPTDDMELIGVATGLSYPIKAERARRNPRVGLLVEGAADEPVISIRGRAATRDSNLQDNAIRYVAETGFAPISFGLPWSEARKAVWYFTRIIVEVAPERIMWWDDPSAMDGPPKLWSAPADAVFPESDPRPPGRISPSAQWKRRSWQEMAATGIERGSGAHLTLCDADGYPLPFRARSVERVEDGFRLAMPKGLPWSGTGKATLTFEGIETFVGEAMLEGDTTVLKVERALPEHPLMLSPVEVLQPSEEVRGKLMARLEEETRRRGQPIPTLPEEAPAPTRLARLRQRRMASGVEITGVTRLQKA